jgi:hypothetical protein
MPSPYDHSYTPWRCRWRQYDTPTTGTHLPKNWAFSSANVGQSPTFRSWKCCLVGLIEHKESHAWQRFEPRNVLIQTTGVTTQLRSPLLSNAVSYPASDVTVSTDVINMMQQHHSTQLKLLTATGLAVRGLNHGGVVISNTCPDRPWAHPAFCATATCLWGKRPGRWVNHPPSSAPRLKKV